VSSELLPETDSESPFQAPWWLPGGHLQTFWRKLTPVGTLLRQRHRVELADGDFIDVDIALAAAVGVSGVEASPVEARDNVSGSRPLVFLLHGLAGCSASPYIIAMQSLLQAHGYDSAAMNLRGCSGEFNRLATAYHSGCSDDVEQVVSDLLGTSSKERALVVVGYSLGANVLIKWLSETRHSGRVQAAISVSNPFSLDVCCGRMNSGPAFWYGRYFLQRLRGDLQNKLMRLEEQGLDSEIARIRALGTLNGLRTLWDFDDAVTAPLHGFASAGDYYQRCSSRQFLPLVSVPTLVIHGHNDPIIPPHALPGEGEAGPHIVREILPAGGHVGFASRTQAYWLERRILRFLELTQGGSWCTLGGK
jgi:uncharacterized protein